MSPQLTRRVLAFLELNPYALRQPGLAGTVLKVNHLWQGPPLSRETLQEVCRLVWLTHQERVADAAHNEPDTHLAGPVGREPVL